MAAMYTTRPMWEDKQTQMVPKGVVVEKLRPSDAEFKVFVALGKAIHYYLPSGGEMNCSSLALAEHVATLAGVDCVRVDIFEDQRGALRVSEFTWNPLATFHFHALDPVFAHTVRRWHRERQRAIRSGPKGADRSSASSV